MDSLKHIAIIPDGNRRWAKAQNKKSIEGHEAGFQRLQEILEEAPKLGVKILSFYAFSTENFSRSQEEVASLMGLLERALNQFSKELKKNKIQLRISGSYENLSPSLVKKINKVCKENIEGDFILNICFNYGAQEDIIQATKKITQHVLNQDITIEQINKDLFQHTLWNGDLPPVDLMIRTSGEERISNFLLWQCAYAEFYFSPKLWPDFSFEDLETAVNDFSQRQRRYGS